MTEFVDTKIEAHEDPQMALTFNAKDGSKVVLTITVSVDGDLRKVWDDMNHLDSDREALHAVANDLFLDIGRDIQ